MPDKPASNQLGMEQVQKPSCSVCWEDFSHIIKLEELRNRYSAAGQDSSSACGYFSRSPCGMKGKNRPRFAVGVGVRDTHAEE